MWSMSVIRRTVLHRQNITGRGGAKEGDHSGGGKEANELVNLEDMKKKLVDLPDEAHVFARVLDDAGVVLIFRDKVVDLIRRVFPTDETAEEAQIKDEFNKMRTMKEEIDVLAHRQVRKILWCGLATAIVQISLFVRLTFWEFSWDVMEPITFFATATSIILGYAYFLITSSDPAYQDLLLDTEVLNSAAGLYAPG
ncbi:hypothetical protein F2Q70_00039861 [Brassica cretica]|uniref:Calcium uniporter protein C-terminal domain-containing protein n=1 Tax=Brassica cretica TaxID=69181 RepID=A0A8S9K6G1_BRACR|nr:hypothetical protein F2Q70_00039861 [Brassica cretica]